MTIKTRTGHIDRDKDGILLIDALERYGDITEDAHFALLILAGFSASVAYRLAYPTRGDNHSVASMASRKLRDDNVQAVLVQARTLYWNGNLRLNDNFPCVKRISAYQRIGKKSRNKRIKPKNNN